MNYIKELNAFYDWLEINSLSTSAIALWHALMHINNKAGWAEEFTVAASVLCIKTGLSDRTIRNARNELKQKNRIDWKTRKGNQSAVYKVISLFDNMSATITDKVSDNKESDTEENSLPEINADNVSVSVSGNTSDKVSGNASTLNKLNKTKLKYINTSTSTEDKVLNFDDEFSQLAKLYQSCGFVVDGLTSDWIADSIEKYSFEWVKNALIEATNQEVRTRVYVNKILNNWKSWGGMKLSSDQKDKPKSIPIRKTRFHTEDNRTDKYSAGELNDIAARKRREHSERMRQEATKDDR